MQALRKGIRLPPGEPGPVTALPIQERVCIPLLWGETPLVHVGEHVYLGQKIADGGGDIVPVHASVSGSVCAVAPRTCHDGRRYGCIALENDGADQWDPCIQPRHLLDEQTDEQLLDILYEAGIRCPHGQPLASAIVDCAAPVGTLIISAIDAEPFLYVQDAAAIHSGEHVLSGIRLLQRLLRPQRTVVAVTAGQKAALRNISRWAGPRLHVCCCADRYPVSQAPLLAAIAADAVPGKSLHEQGIVVLAATDAAAASRAVYDGRPVVHQTVGVDWGQGQALFDVPLGTPVNAVLKAAGLNADSPVILGGPMTGARLENLTVPVYQGLSGLCRLPENQKTTPMTACIRCGRCAAVCPVGLRPYLSEQRLRGDWSLCLHCGACQYSCPAGRPLPGGLNRRGREAAYVG